MIKLSLSTEKIKSSSPESFSLYEKSRFGEKKKGFVEYSFFEALYLLENKKAEVFQKTKALSPEEFIKKAKRQDKKFETKYSAFEDLRSKGYIVKTALKFGAEFRVYDKGIKPGKDHAKWILYTSKESEKINWHDFSAKNRVAHSTKKNLLLAIIDSESSISYYEISWKKP